METFLQSINAQIPHHHKQLFQTLLFYWKNTNGNDSYFVEFHLENKLYIRGNSLKTYKSKYPSTGKGASASIPVNRKEDLISLIYQLEDLGYVLLDDIQKCNYSQIVHIHIELRIYRLRNHTLTEIYRIFPHLHLYHKEKSTALKNIPPTMPCLCASVRTKAVLMDIENILKQNSYKNF